MELLDFGFYIRPGLLGIVQLAAVAWCAYWLIRRPQ